MMELTESNYERETSMQLFFEVIREEEKISLNNEFRDLDNWGNALRRELPGDSMYNVRKAFSEISQVIEASHSSNLNDIKSDEF